MKATKKRACRHCGCRHQTARTARRCAASNPDWQRLRTRAGELASTGARHARTAYDWTAPRVQRGAAATWEGAKAVGRATKRGAKRVAPTVARGARAASERLDRWAAEPNGRRFARNHHGGTHTAGDPLGVYMPPLAEWLHVGNTRKWRHPVLGWEFSLGSWNSPRVRGRTFEATVTGSDEDDPEVMISRNENSMESAHTAAKEWYSLLEPSDITRRR